MLLLAVDTSGKQGSIALARCVPGDVCEVVDVLPLAGGTFSAQLVPQIAALLSQHGFTKQQLEALAVASGPGSFTGLRVGLAAVKALAEVLHKPIAAVSLLEAVAAAGTAHGKLRAALDAGRGEVYVADSDGAQPIGNERLLTLEEFLAASTGAMTTIVTPDHGIAEAARASRLQVEEVPRPRSDAIALLGCKKILRGQTVSAETLDANYVRRSDAEICAKGGG
jgi:tRNA threonylcarbamoyladenosine biosynthesis protein TsaB